VLLNFETFKIAAIYQLRLTTMDQSLKQQQAEQEKIETITPNEPHIA
jgi:ABC-type uncharacterized transport system permease subunit